MNRYLTTWLTALTFLATAQHATAIVTDYELTPSPSTELSAITTLRITFPEAKFLGMYGSDLSGVTLTNADNPSEVYEPASYKYSTFFNSNTETFNFKPMGQAGSEGVSITTPGRYILHIPARSFELSGDWYANLGWSEEINVTYTVSPSGSAGYDEYFNREDIAIRPQPGSVQEFSTVELTFPIQESDVISISNLSVISMTRRGDGKRYEVCQPATDYESILELQFRSQGSKYDIPETIMEPGIYDINIPAGVVSMTNIGIVNPDMVITYEISDRKNDEFGDWQLTPSPGTYSELKTITITFPQLTQGFNFPEGENDVTNLLNGRITLKMLADDMAYTPVYIVNSATKVDDNTVDLTFKRTVQTGATGAETIYNVGDYLLDIPANTFKGKGSDFSFNPHIQATYTIDRDVVANPLSIYNSEPADGSTVAQMDRFNISFPELRTGIAYPFDFGKLRIENVDNPDDYYVCDGVTVSSGKHISTNYSRGNHQFTPITTPGTYRFIAPEGVFIDDSDHSKVNSRIEITFTIDPTVAFVYNTYPASGSAVEQLSGFTISGAPGVTSLQVADDAGSVSLLNAATGQSIALTHEQTTPTELTFKPLSAPALGQWNVTFPAGYFMQVNASGKMVTNTSALTLSYTVATPPHAQWQLRPADGSTVAGLPAVGITPLGDNILHVKLNDIDAQPTLTGNGQTYVYTADIYNDFVTFLAPDGMQLSPGKYTLNIPAGLLSVYDTNGLSSTNEAFSASYVIVEGHEAQISEGIFILNEGAFGSDFGSINYLDTQSGTMDYEIFRNSNAGATLGVTTQYADVYGSDILVAAKQVSYSTAQGVITVADASTLKLKHRIAMTSGSARAICGVGPDKAYVSTSTGIYPIDLASGTQGELIPGTENTLGSYNGQLGDMLCVDGRVYAVRQDVGVYVIDATSDRLLTVIELPDAVTVFVTAEGNMYVACASDTTPFVKLSPDTYATTPVDYTGSDHPGIVAQWSSWRKAPLDCSISGEWVYYISQSAGDGAISAYNFATGEYIPQFVTLPYDDGRWMQTYGSAVSVDPVSGYIVIQAVAMGGGAAYRHNRIYFADARTGSINTSKTFAPDDNYWFPAMAFYPVVDEPMIADIPPINISEVGQMVQLDLDNLTSLSTGNRYLISYCSSSSNPEIATVTRDNSGLFSITACGNGCAELTLTASYRGCVAINKVPVMVGSSGIDAIEAETDHSLGDVYAIDGRLVMRQASIDDLKKLPKGVYIHNNKKIIN